MVHKLNGTIDKDINNELIKRLVSRIESLSLKNGFSFNMVSYMLKFYTDPHPLSKDGMTSLK